MTAQTDKPSCPECGKPASGNFCQHCGASLGGRFCNQCGEKVPSGSKFCNHCGSAVAAGAAAASRVGAGSRAPAHRDAAAAVVGGQNLPWWIAGVSMFVLIFVIGLNMVRPGPRSGPAAGTPAASSTAGAASGVAPDISNMTPIEAADRLFNRVMQSAADGDTAGAMAFMPMALAAYERARPLSLDGLFHLSMLNRTAGNLEASLDNAVEILDQDPNHLLGLASAAETSVALGETDQAEGYYRKVLEVYDSEMGRALEEYTSHAAIVNGLRSEAEQFLSGR